MLSEFPQWRGLVGSPDRVPADAEVMQLVASASTLVFVGMGRFLSYVPPRVRSVL
jgi:hypothetical protein